MAQYVDIETSAEALEEEKELTEAVEALVGQAASSVRDEIVTEITETVLETRAWIEAVFPLLVLYQEQRHLFFEHIKALGIFTLLTMTSFFLLAPWRRKRRKPLIGRGRMLQRSNSFRLRHHPRAATMSLGRAHARRSFSAFSNPNAVHPGLFARPPVQERLRQLAFWGNAPSSPQSSYAQDNEPETDEERFEQEYERIMAEENYTKLLLPPICRRIENATSGGPPSSSKQPQTEINKKPIRKKKEKVRDADDETRSLVQGPKTEVRDNPALRLQTYSQYIVNIVLHMAGFFYAQGQWPLVIWFIGLWQQLRQRKRDATDDINSEPTEIPTNAGDSPRKAAEKLEEEPKEISDEVAAGPMKIEGELLKQDDDDNTDATSGVETTVDGDGPSAARWTPPLIKKECHVLPAAEEPMDDASFHTPKSMGPNIVAQVGQRGPFLKLETNDSKPYTTNLRPAQHGDRRLAGSPFRSITDFFVPPDDQDSQNAGLTDTPVPDRNGYILGDKYLPSSQQTPLLVFVNSRSGPQQGHLLIGQLRRLLNPIQVWDLADGGPGPILESFSALTKLRILVCGGDGSVSWIINELENLNLQRKWPPIGILPLGTGNDLARIMGWGGGYSNESLIGILEQIADAYTSLLDRWQMIINDNGKKSHKNFFNYFGIGADAEAALQVHYLRESRPDWFFSRLVNKVWYGVFGAEDIIKNQATTLHKDMILYADGVEVPLPSDSQGIIVLNIDSYMGGIPIWSHGMRNPEHSYYHRPGVPDSQSKGFSGTMSDDYPLRRSNSMGDRSDSSDNLLGHLTEEQRYDVVTSCDLPTSCQDGILEVVSIRSMFHLGQIRVGLSNAQRLCQCRHIKIATRKKVAFQVDGEPWRQDKCTLEIRRKSDPALMLHRSLQDGAETEMSKLLDWAEERTLIDGTVHKIMMKEFSRRIESKTRRRRSATGGVLQNFTRRRLSNNVSSHIGGGMTSPMSQPNLQSSTHSVIAYALGGRSDKEPHQWTNPANNPVSF